LLALFYPLLLALSALSKAVFGHGFAALGFLPSLLALTLYSMLPILRNGVAGLTGVDPALIEAAKGVRMTDRQRLPSLHLGRAAARCAGDHGRRAHRRGLDHRRGDTGDAGRPDLARQLHLLGPADRGLGVRAVRLRRLGGPGARRRSAAGADRERPRRAQA